MFFRIKMVFSVIEKDKIIKLTLGNLMVLEIVMKWRKTVENWDSSFKTKIIFLGYLFSDVKFWKKLI